MALAPHRPFDLESTEASQVYGGAATNPRALRAVRDTAGVVLAFDGRVLPAFFASATGPRGQDAAAAFPGRVPDLAPLRATTHPGLDAPSPAYTWSVTRPTDTLTRRLAAWGAANAHPVAALRGLTRVAPAALNRVGRPTAFTLTDGHRRTFTLACEDFRNACNTAAPPLAPLTRADRLLSSDVTVTVTPTATTLTGRGHGHGVGLSQWGAKTLADRGHLHPAILQTYYPTATLRRLY